MIEKAMRYRLTNKSTVGFLLTLLFCSSFISFAVAFGGIKYVYQRSACRAYRNNCQLLSPKELLMSKDSDSEEKNKSQTNGDNFFRTFELFDNVVDEKQLSQKEKARLRRLEVEEGEMRRQKQVRKDAVLYFALFGLQFLPIINELSPFVGLFYFLGMACITVYVAARQETIDTSELINEKNALFAPIGASISLLTIYTFLKFGIDPTNAYAIIVTVFGALSVSDIGVPILRNLCPPEFYETRVPIPSKLANVLEIEPFLPLDGLITLFIGVISSIYYWLPTAMTQKFIISNIIAWSIAMVSLGSISFGSFQTAAILLGGLFLYDVYFVYFSDAMMTVATKVEAPIKFIYPNLSSNVQDYPFSVLGLGDVVVPGLFVRFMNQVDKALKPEKVSYLNVASVAYFVALSVCFYVNKVTNSGQPALFFLDPTLIGSALVASNVNGQFQDVWTYREEKESTNKVKR